MSQVFDNIYTRRSYRSYKSDPVPKELVEKVCEAGTYAATGMNRQSPVIIAITEKGARDRLMELNASIMGRDGTDPFYGAPVVIVVLAIVCSIMGVSTMEEFALPIIFGLLAGTYSSVFLSAAVWVNLRKLKPKFKKSTKALKVSD